MKLEIEFIPTTLRYSSFHRLFSREEWNKLRDEIIEKNGRRCQICGETKGIMNLDPIWSYDDEEHVQKLEGLILLCEMCHYIKHLSIVGTLADRGMLDYNRIIEHFCKVNNCSKEEFEESKAKAFEIWETRSMYKWKRDLVKYELRRKKAALTQTQMPPS